jgi:PAS domain S-box-containing protein
LNNPKNKTEWDTTHLYKSIIENSSIGYVYHKINLDEKGNPFDYEFLEVNKAFETLTGFMDKDIIGKKASEILPNITNRYDDWIQFCGNIAINGDTKELDKFSGIWNGSYRLYRVIVSSFEKDYFVIRFSDITKEEAQIIEIKNSRKEIENIERKLALIEFKENEFEIKKDEGFVNKNLKATIEQNSILDTFELADIIKIPELQVLMDLLYCLIPIGSAIVDNAGKLLLTVGFTDICAKFHRCNSESLKN